MNRIVYAIREKLARIRHKNRPIRISFEDIEFKPETARELRKLFHGLVAT